jgi:SAM-dependent methyltransferase
MEQKSSEAHAYDRWADHYDLGEGDRGPIVAFYRSLLNDRIGSVLELGCGTGIIALAMLQDLRRLRPDTDIRFVGVDGSAGMLKVARTRADSVQWLFGDIRCPPVQGRFDLVFCCFNTLQLLLRDEDAAQALAAAHELLEPNGIFAFDIFQPNPAYLNAAHDNRLVRTIHGDDGRTLELREDTRYDSRTHVLNLEWRLVDRDDAEQPPLARTNYNLRQYFRHDVDRLLAQAGFVVHERFGDFDRSPFDGRSKKQILVCGRG